MCGSYSNPIVSIRPNSPENIKERYCVRNILNLYMLHEDYAAKLNLIVPYFNN